MFGIALRKGCIPQNISVCRSSIGPGDTSTALDLVVARYNACYLATLLSMDLALESIFNNKHFWLMH